MATRIREVRRRSGRTLRQVAEQLGTTEATVSRWEREPHRVTVPVLHNLARVLDCRPHDLLAEDGIPAPAGSPERDQLFVSMIASLAGRDPDSLALMMITSDVMAPTLERGDVAIIDTAAGMTGAGLYAFRVREYAMPRRAMIDMATGGVRLTCDNPAYAEQLMDWGEAQQALLGRIIWAGGTL